MSETILAFFLGVCLALACALPANSIAEKPTPSLFSNFSANYSILLPNMIQQNFNKI